MSDTDPRKAERRDVDETDFADVDLEVADDVQVARRPEPRSTFALRLDGATIEQLRSIARRRGTRPTQLARDWLVERLQHEAANDERPPAEADPTARTIQQSLAATEGRLEQRIADFEAMVARLIESQSVTTSPSVAGDDLVTELEARATVARELRQRFYESVTMEAEAGLADLVVRQGDRTWVIDIKVGRSADLVAWAQHLRRVAGGLAARPVLVAPQATKKEAAGLSKSSGVLVTQPDALDDLFADIASAG